MGPTHSGAGRSVGRLSRVFRSTIVLPSTYGKMFDVYTEPTATFWARDRQSMAYVPAAHLCHDLAFWHPRIATGPPVTRDGYFYRTDNEQPDAFSFPPANWDLSREGGDGTSPVQFFETLARFERIHTNRLHVAIAGALLQRRVFLSRGRYFKNRGVYDFSLESFFGDAVTWVD